MLKLKRGLFHLVRICFESSLLQTFLKSETNSESGWNLSEWKLQQELKSRLRKLAAIFIIIEVLGPFILFTQRLSQIGEPKKQNPQTVDESLFAETLSRFIHQS